MTKKMYDLVRLVRCQLYLSPEQLAAIDHYRLARRLPSRAAAIRDMLSRALSELESQGRGRSG
jgi:hypothetical protein